MLTEYLAYAGIGSRETPEDVVHNMRELAFHAANLGWTLRSGGADGADKAFEFGCDDAEGGKKEIFLPWKGFNKNNSTLIEPPDDAYRIAAEIHPVWKILKQPARRLVARNMQQIMGVDLKIAVKCVVCWTQDGCESFKTYTIKTGGTGTAICLASLNNIPVFNLKNIDSYEKAVDFLITQHVKPTETRAVCNQQPGSTD